MPSRPLLCSAQVMIAEKASRRRGLAAEALWLLMTYAAKHLVRLTLQCHGQGCFIPVICKFSCFKCAAQPQKRAAPQTSSHLHLQGVTKFRAKIGEANAASLALFQERLGFVEVSRSSIFQEVTLELRVDSAAADGMWADRREWRRSQYDAP